MSIASTSREVYTEIKTEGVLGRQSKIIYNWVLKQITPKSLREISQGTGIDLSAVAGRVNDMKTGRGDIPIMLYAVEKRKCTITGRTIAPVTAINPILSDPQTELHFG